jgi:FtsZ-binding cell division protein ZapB
MLHSPHIPYLVNGQYGYVGSTVGARVRFASDGTTSSFWDAGVPSYAGADRFTIARNEVPLMVVTNNTRVGIGTTLPEASLDIAAGNIQIADAARLGFQITDVFSFDAKSMGQYSIGWYGDSWEPGGNTLWMSGFGGIRMFTNGQPRMSINRSGFVGINSNTPQHRFTIGNASDGQNVQLRVFADDGYAWKGGAAFGHTSASVILGESSGVATIGGHNGNLSAWSTLAINPAGGAYVGIGTYTPDVMLSVNGQVRASCGLLICSDRNYKREIVPIAHALRDLLKLEGVSYYWRTDEFTNMGFTEDQQLAVIAQNVEAYFPQAVQTMPSGLKTVDYTKLVPVLIEALKEENSQRTANEQQLMRLIQDLADQNRDLQQQLDALKADTQKAANK